MRIGHGFDVHALIPGRPLVLGGVEITHDKGLLGHSDADVLLHAICDACLGALGEGDLGKHFPDTDERYRGIDSRELLRHVRKLVLSRRARIENIDSTVVAQRPKLSSYIPLMRSRIAEDLDIDPAQVNVKATSTEGLSYIGKEQGIAAYAVVLLTHIT